MVSNIFSAYLSALQVRIELASAYLEPMHKETEECHEIGQFRRFELGDNPGNELGYKLRNGGSDSIDELRE
jgi:hypothetical protein